MAVHHSFPLEIQYTFVLLVLAVVFQKLFDVFVNIKQEISEEWFCFKNAITHEKYSKDKTNAMINAIKELEETYSKKKVKKVKIT